MREAIGAASKEEVDKIKKKLDSAYTLIWISVVMNSGICIYLILTV